MRVIFLAALCCVLMGSATAQAYEFSPCGLVPNLLDMRARIASMDTEIRKATDIALRLHQTSRRYGYEHIERDEVDLHKQYVQMLHLLTNDVIILDFAHDDAKKERALDIIAAYWSSLEILVDFTDALVLFEQDQNLISFNQNPQYLTFGVNKHSTMTNAVNLARQQLEQRIGGPQEAMRLLRVPEHRYGVACPAFSWRGSKLRQAARLTSLP